MKEDRRMADIEAHNNIMTKLTVIDERQQVVLKRLDKINGTVQDYNLNKHKWDFACSELLENKLEHKNFLSTKVFTRVSTVLALLITIATVLNLFGIQLGG
jgi:hypothetical protein